MLTTLLAAAVLLGVLILVHELGHFWAAKAVDIRVERFSIGFGPKVVGFRKGETEYVIAWLPLGGYVKMAGMDEEEALEAVEGPSSRAGEGDGPASEPGAPGRDGGEGDGGRTPPGDGPGGGEDHDPSRDFAAKPLWARFLAISGGVAMNFLFAVAAFAAIAGVWGMERPREARVGDVVEEALPPGALELARLPRGIAVEAVGGERVEDWDDVALALATAGPGPVTLRMEGGRTVSFTLPADDSALRAAVGALQPVRSVEPLIGDVVEGGPADSAGVEAGDRVVQVEGRAVATWQEFAAGVESRPGRPVSLTLERDGGRRTVTVVPEERILAFQDDTLRYGRIRVAPSQAAYLAEARASRERVGPVAALGHGFAQSWEWTVRIVEVVVDLVAGDVAAESLGGPLRIGQWAGEAARFGPVAFLRLMAIISVNLAILNLLPVPVLDGGHLVFLSLEAVRGRPVSVETRLRWTQVGMLLLVALMVWAIGNDILQIFG